jgi:glutathione S-transferase
VGAGVPEASHSAAAHELKTRHPGFKVWAGAQAVMDRIATIWSECFARYGGPYLFGEQLTMADAMYAPVVTRFLTYDVPLSRECAAYCRAIMKWPAMVEWIEAAKAEPAELQELDMEF